MKSAFGGNVKKFLAGTAVGAVAIVFSVGIVSAEVNAVTPSTNDVNRTNGWAHVDQLSQGIGTTNLEFISTRNFYSCFEYRTDGDTSQKIGDTNYNTNVTDVLYPYYCQRNDSSTHTINANEYVEVRMVFGAETDERFDWTRFDVIPALTTPTINGFLSPTLPCGALTNIHSTTVDWTDSTGGVGGVVGYEYTIDYPLVGGGIGHWTTFLAPSQRSGALNEGLHTIRVRAKDSAGNFSAWSNSCSITADWTAPLVTVENPNAGDSIQGTVDIYGTIFEGVAMGNYNIAIYPGDANFNDFSKRLEQKDAVINSGFNNQLIYQWDTTGYADGEYLIRLAARDKAGNRDLSKGPYLGGDDSQHVIRVTVNNTPDTKNECKSNGWKTFFTPAFKNQGDCVSYVQSNENAVGNKTK